ncbi:MFS transporter [Chloroflexus aggregans]|uniref:Major facilitator superfamily MFS_1 n=1 Tax=Chloroflexus aggregans (strain MD-66 / DSM 9485) TaxID=326427 RepID=B8G5D7_CHLAD|nr:MFS transporter [Chloroflexus aggregans]ACL25643.1 major facilitator superfamily MFS_1 [Chloroflexus aggregans DSM 9485]
MRNDHRYLLTIGLLTTGLTVGWLFATIAYAELGYGTYRLRVPLFGDLTLIGLLNSAPILAGGICGPVVWQSVRRWGARQTLILGCLAHGAALLTLALSPHSEDLTPLTAWTLVGGIALSGPASVLVNLAGPSLMMQLSSTSGPDRLFSRSAALSLITGGIANLVAGSLAMVWRIVIVESDAIAPYRFNATFSAVIVALAGLPLLGLHLTGSQPLPPTTTIRRELRELWPTLAKAIIFVPGPLLISFGAALFIPYLSLFFRQRFTATDAIIGLLFALISLATGLATLVGPRLSARIGRMQGVVLTQALAIPCLIALAFAPALPIAALIAMLRSALMNMATPLFEAHALSQTPPEHHPTVIGLIRAAASVGYIAGPTISAELQSSAGFTPILLIAALCYTVAVIVNATLFVWHAPSPQRNTTP